MTNNPLKIIDLQDPAEITAAQLLEAATTQGFLFIDGHCFSEQHVDSLFALSKEFFTNVGHDEKLRYKFNVNNNYGYTDYTGEQGNLEKAIDFKECYNFGSINFKEGTFNTPNAEEKSVCDEQEETPELFKANSDLIAESLQKYYELAKKIMSLITVALEIDQDDYFTSKFKSNRKNGCVLRFLHYPLFRSDNINDKLGIDPDLRIGPHTDYGALTLLMQRRGEEGLEVQLEGDQEQWVKVPFLTSRYDGSAPPLVVNFGDMLNFWTNGVIKSTKHRVRIKPGDTRSSDRYSIVFFVHPDAETKLGSVPSPLIEYVSNATRRPSIKAYEYLENHLRRINT